MFFDDRIDAGRQLAVAVKSRNFEKPVVLGIPRGGVPVAAEVARAVDGQLAVVVARKLGAPGNPELAIGATTESGVAYINDAVAVAVGADKQYIEAERQRQVREAHHREEMFNSHRRPPVRGRTVIIVDDGIATGATAIAAVRSIKAEGAARVVLAVPVGAPHTMEVMRGEADEVICLDEPENFWAVGQFYGDFRPVDDEEVLKTLEAFEMKVPADPARDVEITRDGVRLAGSLATPDGPAPFPLVIFVHGLGSSKESPRNVVIANHLVDAGIATLLFDLSGHGESSDDPVGGLEAYVADLEAAFQWASGRAEVRKDFIGIAGSSMGATVAVAAAAEGRVHPRTMVLRAPPVQPQEFRRIHVPSLVLIGSQDPLRRSVEAGVRDCPELTLSLVEGAGHLFEEPGTLRVALDNTVDWFRSRFFAPAVREETTVAVATPDDASRRAGRASRRGHSL
jgi:predicted phosphoribosyltransferase/pimeloyl-ACP methyl ester carboxylesterase